MHPIVIACLVALGIVWWVGSIHLVNEEVFKLRWLVRDPSESIYSVKLSVPNWRVLRTMAQQRFWVIVALVLAPVLVVIWGLVLVGILMFILFPQFIGDIAAEAWWTIKERSSHS